MEKKNSVKALCSVHVDYVGRELQENFRQHGRNNEEKRGKIYHSIVETYLCSPCHSLLSTYPINID